MTASVQSDHPLVVTNEFATNEEYVLHLIHQKAYEHASVICEGRTVLDWGCNNGYGLPILAKTASKVGGLDTNKLCVQAAHLRSPEYANDVWLFNGRDIPTAKRDWGAVTSFQVIEHVHDINAYLGAIRSVLSEDGTALFTTPNREIRLDPGMKPWNDFHVNEFTAAELKAILRDYFRYVEVLGLQGDGEIVNVERARCARARDAARTQRSLQCRILRRISNPLERVMRVALPPALRRVCASWYYRASAGVPAPPLTHLINERLSTSQLFYSAESVENSVDLLAVCSNTPSECVRIE